MPKDFQYDIIQLINSVKERPCLWDKSLESYKDRIERRLAWEEVFNLLESDYEQKPSKEKKKTEEQIMNRWTNIRDSFVKTLKKSYGTSKRKYIYHKELNFLINGELDIPNSDEADYCSTECTDNSMLYNMSQIKYEQDAGHELIPTRYSTRKRSKKRDSVDKNSDFNFVGVDETNDQRVMNEDEAFFASLLPSVVKYTEDERLEFRIQVLALMRRIKENRK